MKPTSSLSFFSKKQLRHLNQPSGQSPSIQSFIQKRIPKCQVKLNDLQQINSLHSSVYTATEKASQHSQKSLGKGNQKNQYEASLGSNTNNHRNDTKRDSLQGSIQSRKNILSIKLNQKCYKNNNIDNSQNSSVRNMVNSSYFNSVASNMNSSRESEKDHQNRIIHNIQQHQCPPSYQSVASILSQKNSVLLSKEKQKQNHQRFSKVRHRSQHRLSSSSSLTTSKRQLQNPSFNRNQNQAIVNAQQQKKILQPHHQPLNQAQKQQIRLAGLPIAQQVQALLTKHFKKSFIKNLVEFMNRTWAQEEAALLESKRVQPLINMMMQKSSSFDQLVSDFVNLETAVSKKQLKNRKANGNIIQRTVKGQTQNTEKTEQTVKSTSSHLQASPVYSQRQARLINSIILKQAQKMIQSMRSVFEQLVSRLPEDGVLQQERTLQGLRVSLLQIYDPKYTYSNEKMKERTALYYESYCSQRASLQTEIVRSLRPELDFITGVQGYLSSYQKQLQKLKAALANSQAETQHLMVLIDQKTTFTPLTIDFQRLQELKGDSEQRVKQDFEKNVVFLHTQKYQKQTKKIQALSKQLEALQSVVDQTQLQKQKSDRKLQEFISAIPKTSQASTQVFNLPMAIGGGGGGNDESQGTNKKNAKKSNAGGTSLSVYVTPFTSFLDNVTSPFTFNEKITSSLITVICIDKILYDFQPIRNKAPLMPFHEYMYEWFIIRTGNKRVAQVLIKNFAFSLRKYRNRHKRFGIFGRIFNVVALRNKSIQQDIEHLFYQSHLAWYYLVKLALAYRKRLKEDPTGFQLLPPIGCEEIFKLSLRKSYDLILQFLTEEQIPIPENLNQKVDHYAINEISKYKQHDENFQKQQLQEIHILRQMNFDTIAGFVLDLVASQKAVTLEAMLRSVHLRQQQNSGSGGIGLAIQAATSTSKATESPPVTISSGNIGYSQFEPLYRKYYKEKRSKIELIFTKLCLCNMNDILKMENVKPVVMFCIEDETPLRQIFDKEQNLKTLIIPQKQTNFSKYQKRVQQPLSNPNSFEHFRDRYYQQYYDFYDMTIFLEQVFRIVKGLIRKKLKRLSKDEAFIQNALLTEKKYSKVIGDDIGAEEMKQNEQNQDRKQQDQSSSDEQSDEDSEQQSGKEDQKDLNKNLENKRLQKSHLELKVQEWNKIQDRIPHFTTKVLTIDQIVIHTVRRKEMFQGCQFAWRTLRQILTNICKG